jgi:hypothetical protein
MCITSRLITASLFIVFFLAGSVVYAQNANTTHVFPQFVDGVTADGWVFTSRFVIASIGGFPATCNVSLFGIGVERLSASVLVQPASWEAISSRGRDVVASGYYVTFVDEIFSVPQEGTGTLEILANGSAGSDNFNITALLFDRGAFTNVVPAVERPVKARSQSDR